MVDSESMNLESLPFKMSFGSNTNIQFCKHNVLELPISRNLQQNVLLREETYFYNGYHPVVVNKPKLKNFRFFFVIEKFKMESFRKRLFCSHIHCLVYSKW